MANTKKSQSSNKFLWIWIAVALLFIGGFITLAVLSSIPSQVSAQIAEATRVPANISVQTAADKLAQGTYLLDVRQQSEWEEGHVDGAVLIPLDQLEARMDEIPADQEVMIICRSGNRSGQARDLLRAKGLLNTTSVDGGMNAWISAGLPVVTGP